MMQRILPNQLQNILIFSRNLSPRLLKEMPLSNQVQNPLRRNNVFFGCSSHLPNSSSPSMNPRSSTQPSKFTQNQNGKTNRIFRPSKRPMHRSMKMNEHIRIFPSKSLHSHPSSSQPIN